MVDDVSRVELAQGIDRFGAEAAEFVGDQFRVGLTLARGDRERTRETCDVIARIPFAGGFGSLNVSNAAAVSLYAASTR